MKGHEYDAPAPPRRLHAADLHPYRRVALSWRMAGRQLNLARIRQLIAVFEAAKFGAFFMADHLAVLNMPEETLRRSHTVSSFKPFTLLSALAVVPERIGLIATASTT
jgi:alkanesulfonate monooxygenase SsuD/methylene tetrahydromethanopterin reductase-like flavin-dependent oxidoreductase (luciferase family)